MEIDEEFEPSQEYVDAFNESYLISQYMPELADSLSKTTGETDIIKGFKDGKETFANEHFESKLPKFLRDNPFESKETDIENLKDRDLDRDIDFDIDR